MNSAGFPINDLTRRKLQTGLTILTLTLVVTSTLFLMLFSSRLGVGIIASTAGTMTLGLSAVFGQFIVFIGVLIFIIGAVLTSSMVFLMMSQRTRDFGLIKAAGCPNSLIGGYFMTELLTVTLVGCILGIAFGFLADFIVANLVFSGYSLPNFWSALFVFIVFFFLSAFFGLRPILNASKIPALQALSPINYYGLTETTKHKPLSKRAITWRISLRSLYRRQSAALRLVVLLSIAFVLLTVSIAGGTIANDTSISSIKQPVDTDTIAIGNSAMITQYKALLGNFSQPQETADFNYSSPQLTIPQTLIEQLSASNYVAKVDSRLVIEGTINEIPSASLGETSTSTNFVGGHRQRESIIVGVDPSSLAGSWSLKGAFFTNRSTYEAVIGDSIANTMFVADPQAKIEYSNALLEGVGIGNDIFHNVGICVDPLNNGYVTYIPIESLQNTTGTSGNNMLLVKFDASSDRNTAINALRSIVQASGYDLEVSDLKPVIDQNTAFLSSNWQTIMLLPLFTLASATICLVSFMMLSVDEQHQEFAILRAIGAKPRIITNISAIQSAILLLSGFGIGISLGVPITVTILMANPIVTVTTLLTISTWLLSALAVMFILSVYPAHRLSKASIIKIMT